MKCNYTGLISLKTVSDASSEREREREAEQRCDLHSKGVIYTLLLFRGSTVAGST